MICEYYIQVCDQIIKNVCEKICMYISYDAKVLVFATYMKETYDTFGNS